MILELFYSEGESREGIGSAYVENSNQSSQEIQENYQVSEYFFSNEKGLLLSCTIIEEDTCRYNLQKLNKYSVENR